MNGKAASSIQQGPSGGYTVVVDGYNLIMCHRIWHTLELTLARQRLTGSVLTARWPFPVNRWLLVFDGPQNTSNVLLSGRVVVHFSHPSADAYILKLIRSTSEPKCLVVISDDRELIQAAKSHGVTPRSSDWFFKRSGSQNTDGLRRSSHYSNLHSEPSEKKYLSASVARQITEELAAFWSGRSEPR